MGLHIQVALGRDKGPPLGVPKLVQGFGHFLRMMWDSGPQQHWPWVLADLHKGTAWPRGCGGLLGQKYLGTVPVGEEWCPPGLGYHAANTGGLSRESSPQAGWGWCSHNLLLRFSGGFGVEPGFWHPWGADGAPAPPAAA